MPPQYKSIGLGNNGTFAVTGKKAVTAITADGQPLAADSPELQQTKPLGLYSFKKDGKYGFINKQGQEVIPFIYNEAWYFSEGFALVEKDGKWFYINKQGECVKDCP